MSEPLVEPTEEEQRQLETFDLKQTDAQFQRYVRQAAQPIYEPPQDRLDALHAAASAQLRKIHPHSAGEALEAARQQNLQPEQTLGEHPSKQISLDELAHIFDNAPGVAKYAAKSAVHAAAIGPDARAWSNTEFFLSGRFDAHTPTQPFGVAHLPVWADVADKAYRGTAAALIRFFAEIGGAGSTYTDKYGTAALERAKEDPARYARIQAEDAKVVQTHAAMVQRAEELSAQASRPTEGTEGSSVRSATAAVGGAVAGALPYIATEALPGGPALTFALMHAESYGRTRNAGVSPEAAQGAALVSAAIGAGAGHRFLSGVLARPVVKDAQAALADQITRLATKPGFADFAKSYGKHYASAALMNAGVAMTESLATHLDEAGRTGEPVNWSEVSNDLIHAGESTLAMAPLVALGPVRDTMEARGRWIMAHDAQVRLNGASVSSGLAQKLSISEAKDLLGGMNLPDAMIDPETFAQAARSAKLDPEMLARKVVGDDGTAWHAAALSGSPLRVPMKEFITTLRDLHEKLIPSTKLAHDEVSLKEAEADDRFSVKPGEVGSSESLERRKRAQDPNAVTQEIRPLTPEQINGDDERPSAKARKAYADVTIAKMTVGALDSTDYGRVAARAQRLIDKLNQQAVNKLSGAEQTAQQGIDLGVKGAEAGQLGITASEGVRKGPTAIPDAADKSGQAQAQAAVRSQPAGVPQRVADALRSTFKRFMKAQGAEARAGVLSPDTDPKVYAANFEKQLEAAIAASPPPQGVSPELAKKIIRQSIDAEVERAMRTKQPSMTDATIQTWIKDAYARLNEAAAAQQGAEDKSVRATEKTVAAGEKAAEAMRQAQIRDLNRSLETARAKVVETARKQERAIDKLNEGPARVRMWIAAPEFGIAHDSLMSALGKDRRPVDPLAFATLEDTHGVTLDFDREIVEDLLRNNRSFDDLKPDEAAQVQRAFANLHAVGNEQYAALLRDRSDAQKIKTFSIIGQTLERQWTQYTVGAEPGKAAKLHAEQLNAESILHMLGPVGDVWADRLQQALKYEDDLSKKFSSVLAPKVPKNGSDLVPMLPIDRGDPALTNFAKYIPRSDLWVLQLHAGSESGMKRLVNGFKLPESVIEGHLRQHITKAEMDFVQSIHDANAEIFKLETEVHMRRAGVPPEPLVPRRTVVVDPTTGEKSGYKGGYTPFYSYDRLDHLPLDPKDPYDGLRAGMDSPHGFAKERVDGHSRVPDIRWDQLSGHYRAIFHDVSHSDLVRDVWRALHTPEFRNVLLQKYGPAYLDPNPDSLNPSGAIDQWLRTAARGYEPAAVTGAAAHTALIVRATTSLAANAAFDYNPKVMAGQTSHLLVAKSALGLDTRHMAAGTARWLTTAGRDEAMQESQVVPFRDARYVAGMNEMITSAGGLGEGKFNAVVEALRRPSQEAYRQIDHALSVQIWHATKAKAVELGMSNEDANTYADRGLRKVMPVISMEQASAFAKDKGALGALFLVRGFPNAVYNMQAMAAWEVRQSINRGQSGLSATWRWAGQFAGITSGVALGHYLMGHGRNEAEQNDDGGTAKFAARSLIHGATYMHPLGAALSDFFLPIALGEVHSGKEAISNVRIGEWAGGSNVIRALQDVGDAFYAEDGGERLKHAINAAGHSIGLPPPAMMPEAEAWYKAATGGGFQREPVGALDYASLFAYGERRETNIFRDIADLAAWLRGE